MNQNNRVIRFLNSEILFKNCDFVENELERVFSFFASHFEVDYKVNGRPIATIEAYPYRLFNRERYSGTKFNNIVIRRSSAKEFNLDGEKAYDGNLEIIDSQGTETALVLNSKDKTIIAYLSSGSHVQFVDFIRDLVTKHEENCGTLILHAAAAADHKNNGLVIVGEKGAGKSTFLLDLVGRQGFNFISGDKVFIQFKNGVAKLYGWPEFPHLGYGTLQGHPILIEELSKKGYIIDFNMQDKLLFTSDILKKALGYTIEKNGVPLKYVVFPDVRAETRETILKPIILADKKQEVLNHFEFSCNNQFAGYHNYMEILHPDACRGMVDRFETVLGTLGFYSVQGSKPIKSEVISMLNDNVNC